MILDTMKAPVFPVSLFLQAIKNYVYFELFLFGLNSSYKCNGIHINNLFKFFVWCEVSKSFTRSII